MRIQAAKKWSEEKIADELKRITGSLGSFPSATELKSMGRNDLCCAITRTGGLIEWSARLGLARKSSDSDTGWEGEKGVMDLFAKQGISCVRSNQVKAPFDLIADSVLRVDVKSARHASYKKPDGKTACSGWFYRLGKVCQADLVFLFKLDTSEFFSVPWWRCPIGNITISDHGGIYSSFQNNWPLIREMIELRKAERISTLSERVA